MGFYIEVPENKGKVAQLIRLYDAVPVDYHTAYEAIRTGERGVVVVVDNGPFEAAGYAFSEREFVEFTDPRDTRPKRFVLMDKDLAERLSGFAKVKDNPIWKEDH